MASASFGDRPGTRKGSEVSIYFIRIANSKLQRAFIYLNEEKSLKLKQKKENTQIPELQIENFSILSCCQHSVLFFLSLSGEFPQVQYSSLIYIFQFNCFLYPIQYISLVLYRVLSVLEKLFISTGKQFILCKVFIFHVLYIYILTFNILMRSSILISVLLLCVFLRAQQPIEDNVPMNVGQIVPGSIDPTVANQKNHLLFIKEIQRKYLFIRISTFETNMVAIGFYLNETGALIHSCMDNSFDTCYVPTQVLKTQTLYIILVMSNVKINYNLYTYWTDLQHLKPGQEIRFMFDETQEKSQLFHIDIEKNATFQQIRVILKPETVRAEGDSLKIFANKGYSQQPTQKQHHYQSFHVWNDAQAIFITKDQLKQLDIKGISIFIVGNAKTVYTLSCEFINTTIHQIQLDQNLYEYVKKNQHASYHINFEQNSQIDNYLVRFSVFTGQVEVGFYYDKQMKNQFTKMPYQYMSDIQFHIEKNDLKVGVKQLYVMVRSHDDASTYQINLQSRKKTKSIEIFQNVFQFVPINQDLQSFHFYSHIWKQDQNNENAYHRFDISSIRVIGEPILEFYVCKSIQDENTCKDKNNTDFYNAAVPVKPGMSRIGTKTLYSIDIMEGSYEDINQVEKRALIVIHVKKMSQENAFAALQLSNPSKLRLLREGRAFEDKVRLTQTKYYKFQNNNPKIKVIKIHINQISGLTKVLARRTDTRSEKNPQQDIKMSNKEPNTIIIKQDVTKPIFLQIYGVVNSIYTITVSSLHQEHPSSSSLVMAQDIEYSIKLLPYYFTIVEIHPIQSQVTFSFNCQGGSVDICQIDVNGLCKTGSNYFGNKGKFNINAENVRQVRLKISNTVSYYSKQKSQENKETKKEMQLKRTVKVSMIYHGSIEHCQERRVNHVYSEQITRKQCFKYILPLSSDITIMSTSSILQIKPLFFVCYQPALTKQENGIIVVKQNDIEDACKGSNEDFSFYIVFPYEETNKDEQFQYSFSVEYHDDTITLADGIAYYTKANSVETAIRTFFYQIIDSYNDLEILLLNKRGKQYFYAKIVQSTSKYSAFVSESEATINSKTNNYYAYPSVTVTRQNIKKSKCGISCTLVISVFSSEKLGNQVQFGVQVTQHQVNLKQNQVKTDYLPKGSVKYYQYVTKKNPTDLLFKISDNNRKCVKSYLSNHPYPSEGNYVQAENEGTMVYKQAKKGRYYLSVEAKEDCPFDISVSEGESKLTKVQFGQHYDIKLNQGQEAWFYLKHHSKAPFKIISLLKHGSLQILGNQTDLNKQVIQNITNKKINLKNFLFKSPYPNSLFISNEAKNFCFNCYYLINVKATKLTEGTIYVGSESSKISLEQDKSLFDHIYENNKSTLAVFYKVSKGFLGINVHNGKVSVSMVYEDQKFEKIYEKNKNQYRDSYQFTKKPEKVSPIHIKITALSPSTIYSLLIQTEKQEGNLIKLNPGQSSFIQINRKEKTCFTGVLSSKEEQIYLISDQQQNLDIEKLQIEAMLNDKKAELRKQTIGKILSFKFEIKQTFFAQPQKYVICVKSLDMSQQRLSLSAIQNQKMNLVSPDTQLVVKNQNSYALHHDGEVLIDVFECQGKADLTYSSDFAQLEKKNSRSLQINGILGQNHALRVQSKEVLFLNVKSKLSTIIWMPFDQKAERGVGYYKYSIGKLSYESKYNIIKFIFGGVFASKETKTSVQQVKYTLYISNSSQNLQKGLMCSMNFGSKLLKIQVNSNKLGADAAPEIQLEFEKKKITDHFKEDGTIYFSVVADVIVNPPNSKEHQHYRFVYPQQIVVGELLKQNVIEQNLNFSFFVGAVTIVAIAAIAILCVFVRFVVPALARLKSRVLVEEGDHRELEMEPPPSSDRNQMETDEKMG